MKKVVPCFTGIKDKLFLFFFWAEKDKLLNPLHLGTARGTFGECEVFLYFLFIYLYISRIQECEVFVLVFIFFLVGLAFRKTISVCPISVINTRFSFSLPYSPLRFVILSKILNLDTIEE